MQTIQIAIIFLIFSVLGCANSARSGAEIASNGSEMPLGEALPCDNCASKGEREYAVKTDLWRAEQRKDFAWTKIAQPLGVAPLLNSKAQVQGRCSFCHAFSDDGVAFDFSAQLDQWLAEVAFAKNAPKPLIEVLLPGLALPEKDTLWWAQMEDSLRQAPFLEGKPLADFLPWQSRMEAAPQLYEMERTTPQKLKSLVARIAVRASVKTLLIPISAQVEIFPKKGKSGAFATQILWTLWNAEGELLWVLAHQAFYESKTSTPPDKNWLKEHFMGLQNLKLQAL